MIESEIEPSVRIGVQRSCFKVSCSPPSSTIGLGTALARSNEEYRTHVRQKMSERAIDPMLPVGCGRTVESRRVSGVAGVAGVEKARSRI